MEMKEFRDRIRRAVTHPQPHDLGGMPMKEAPLTEVLIFGNDDVSCFPRKVPDRLIVCSFQAKVAHVGADKRLLAKRRTKSVGEVLIQKQLHAGRLNNRRSRSAANARHARMSSGVKSGKSATICVSDIPEAR